MNDLFHLGLVNALVVAILAAPAYCLSRWGKRPALAHMFWLLILVKLVTPPLWRVPIAVDQVPDRSDKLALRPSAIDEPTQPSTATSHAAPVMEEPIRSAEPEPVQPPQLEPVKSIAPIAAAETDAAPPSSTSLLPAFSFPWKEALQFCWLAGSLIVFALTAFRLSAFVRCLKRVQPVQGEMHLLAIELSERLGLRATPRLGIAPMRMAPLVWGWGHTARVIIPRELWNTLDGDQRAMLLVHELAHLKRGDHWVRLLEIVVRTVYWWHPAVWLAAREMREAEEQCCDAWAVWVLPHAAKSYARAIVDTVDFLSRRSVPLPVGASGIGQVQDLRRRLIMIMRGNTPRELSTTALVGLVIVGGLIFMMSPSFGQQASAPATVVADEPSEPQFVRSVEPVLGISFTAPAAEDEIARLRQQEESLRRAMEAVAKSLEQTKRQLDSMEGAPTRPSTTLPSLPRRAVAVQAAPGPEAQPRPRVSAPRVEALPRSRPVRDVPLEERLSRLEERMSQIADDLQALRHDMRPRTAPARGVPATAAPDVLTPTAPAPVRRQPRPAARPVDPLSAPIAEPAVPGATLVPTPIPPAPPADIAPPVPQSAPRRPVRSRSVDSDDSAPQPVRPGAAAPAAVPAPPARPPAEAPAIRSVDEKPEIVSPVRP